MISNYVEERGRAPFCAPAPVRGARRHAVGTVQWLSGLVLAAGFVLSLAGRYEGQLILAERIQQELVGR